MIFMEVPKHWREMPINAGFMGVDIKPTVDKDGRVIGKPSFKYPGGEIVLAGSFGEIYERFVDKGFTAEVIEKILFNIYGAVASEAAVSFEKIVNSKEELVGSEVGKQGGGEVELGVDRLPGKITRKTLFSASANN